MSIQCAADIIRDSHRVVVLTGAGISTPSGIPDFRSPNSGLWEKFDPFEVASLSSFRYDPPRFYNWLQGLALTIIHAEPNPAHISLAHLQELGYAQTIITQNIDALLQRAGARNVLEVHGSIRRMSCTQCYSQYDSQTFLEGYLQNGEIPICPSCGGVLKPDLILMGEQLPVRVWLKAQEASKECDLMIVAGSSLEVLPVAGLPMRALGNGAHLILINFSPTYLDERADVVLHEDVADVLPSIVEMVERGRLGNYLAPLRPN
jgi:NAD-dependent protein deacetylase/lipoamidase